MQTKTIIKSASKYSHLLEDGDVARWVRNLERGSAVTGEVSVRRLGKASELLGLSPQEMITEAQRNPKKFQDSLEDIVCKLETESKAPGYIANLVKIVRQWLKYNDVLLTRQIKIKNSTSTPKIQDECVPSQQELAKLLRSSSSRIRVAISLMAFADLRPESIGNFDGSDGLRLSDLPEVVVESKGVSFRKIPTIVTVRASLSKAKHKYFSFLGSEGTAYLREYLDERIRREELLGPDSSLITHEREEKVKVTKPFLLTRTVTRHIRLAMRRSGLSQRPYSLRAYAQTGLTIAESKVKVSHAYIQFFSGHRGDMTARYSTHKGSLPPEMIEGMRSAYQHCEPFLSTTALPTDQMSTVKEAKIEALKSIAKSMFDIDLLEVKVAKERSENRDLSQEETIQLFEAEMKRRRSNNQQELQLIVDEPDLENRLRNGWQFVSALPSQRILVRRIGTL